jgi:hypothetical protein
MTPLYQLTDDTASGFSGVFGLTVRLMSDRQLRSRWPRSLTVSAVICRSATQHQPLSALPGAIAAEIKTTLRPSRNADSVLPIPVFCIRTPLRLDADDGIEDPPRQQNPKACASCRSLLQAPDFAFQKKTGNGSHRGQDAFEQLASILRSASATSRGLVVLPALRAAVLYKPRRHGLSGERR